MGEEPEHAGAGKGLLTRVDDAQQRHPWSALPAAIVRKYGEDGGGKLVAQLAYSGFLSLFPLLLVLTTVLGYVVGSRPELRDDLVDSALAQFPIIGDQLRTNVGTLQGSGLALTIGLVTAIWGGLGVAQAAQDVLATVWMVPHRTRPPFAVRLIRATAMFAVLGGGLLTTSLLAESATRVGQLGWLGDIGVFVVTVAVNTVWFALALRILLPAPISWRGAVPGSVLAAVGWQVLLALGTFLVDRQLRGATASYGFFGIVLGLLAWLALLATVLVVAAELNVVLERRLWPRSFVAPPRTVSDLRALGATARVQERVPGERIMVHFDHTDTAALAADEAAGRLSDHVTE